MFREQDFKVVLTNPDEVKTFIKKHGEFAAVCYDTPKDKAEQVGMHCLERGHLSGSRHLFFIFELSNIPRFTIDQLVRHEIGVVKNVQSLRYCNKNGKVSIYCPPEVAKDEYALELLKENENVCNRVLETLQFTLDNSKSKERLNEVARTIIPIGISSSCSIALNLEGMIHLCNVRLCNRAELPLRHLVRIMAKEIVKVEPRYLKYLVPNCMKLGYCPEGNKKCELYKANRRG